MKSHGTSTTTTMHGTASTVRSYVVVGWEENPANNWKIYLNWILQSWYGVAGLENNNYKKVRGDRQAAHSSSHLLELLLLVLYLLLDPPTCNNISLVLVLKCRLILSRRKRLSIRIICDVTCLVHCDCDVACFWCVRYDTACARLLLSS